MIFHLTYELPAVKTKALDCESPDLTEAETFILKEQIQTNTVMVDCFIDRIDLLVNKEGHGNSEAFIQKLRKRLSLLMEENDTFRKVLWRAMQKTDETYLLTP